MYDYLVEFVTLVREGSFTKAARRLSLSQSVLSRHISSLETALATRLLDRNTHGFKLTEHGEYVLQKASDIVELGRDIKFHVAAPSQEKPLVRIGGALTSYTLMRAIHNGAHEAHVEVAVVNEPEGGSLLKVLEDVDAYFTFLGDPELSTLGSAFKVTTVFLGSFLVAMEQGHPLAAKQTLAIDDLADQTAYRLEGNYLSGALAWEEYKRVCQEAGFYPRSRSVRFAGPNDLYAFDLGDCIATLVEGTPVVQYAREAGYVLVPVPDTPFPVIVGVCRTDNAAAMRLTQVLAGRLAFNDANERRAAPPEDEQMKEAAN